MATLDIIVKPKLKFTLKKCGDVVPYGITPEEKAKLAGIEENANNYTHPETHPASILYVVDVVNGAANKFLNERGEMVAVATSSIGVTGSQLYASTENSDVAGYKSLVGTPQPLESEIALTAKSSDGIVWGAKYLSAPFTEAVTIPTTAYGFDYWRKVSAANGTSRKHLRVFLYRAGVETNIITPLASPDIEDVEFTERQISYIFPELVLLAGDRIGIQEGFSTTHANNITLTYIVGDGRGWFMRLPLPIKHEDIADKNSETAFQHVDSTAELGEAINEATHSLILWNGTKALKVLFSRLVTFFESYFLKFGGQNFGTKKTIGSNDNQDFAVKTNNIERAVFTKDGKVGLNVAAPSELIEMNGNLYINNTDPLIYGYLKRTYIDMYDSAGGITIKLLSTSNNLTVLGGLSLSGGLSFVGDLSLAVGNIIKSGGTPNSIQLYNGSSGNMIFKVGLADSSFDFINRANASLLFIKDNGNIGIGDISPKSKLKVQGAIQIADDTAAASANKEGAIRYRKDANNSYIEMCMQTGSSTYAWVVIKQNTWS